MVEDNPADALLIGEAIRLEGLPLRIHAAADGEVAISFIEMSEIDPAAPSPIAVLLDINLPKTDGFDVLRRIRTSRKHADVPVIILSSSDSATDRDEGARLGAFYFRKCQNYEEFLRIGPAIRQFLSANGLL